MAWGSRRTLAPESAQAPLVAAATRTHTPPPASIMQLPAAVLAVLLCTAALCSPVFSVPYGADTPTACCFSYTRQIARKFVTDYFETSSQCSKPGIIFQTRKGRQICANPSEAWVEEYTTYLELNAE